MKRKYLPSKTKLFIRWAQKDRCFLCMFPLVIYCHYHHIISVDDGGADHYLNLVGLCANHHGMMENLKRTRDPATPIIGTDHPEMGQWHYKSQAALAEFELLAPGDRNAMNHLLSPYWKSDHSVYDIFKNHEPSKKLQLARMIITRDIELLKEINSKRPRIFFPRPAIRMAVNDPYNLLLTGQVELQTAIDRVVNSNANNITGEEYDLVVAQHLLKLGLRGSCDATEKNFRFHFTRQLIFSVREIREMSDQQIYSF